MKRLLVATDLSPRSDRALDRALALTEELESELVVLHLVDEELPSSVADRLKEEAESAIDEQLGASRAFKKGSVARKVEFGTGFRDIIKEADTSEADLIIMGTHRDHSLGDFFLGTTVERVVRRGNQPVLVVKDRMKGPYRRVLVGVDFSVYSRRAVEFALKFVPKGEIILVHAFDLPFKGFIYDQSTLDDVTKTQHKQMDAMLMEEMQALLTSLPSPPASLERIMLEGTVREVLSSQVKKLRPDLLVVGTHGRTGVTHALLGSVAGSLLSEPPCDVLTVKAW